MSSRQFVNPNHFSLPVAGFVMLFAIAYLALVFVFSSANYWEWLSLYATSHHIAVLLASLITPKAISLVAGAAGKSPSERALRYLPALVLVLPCLFARMVGFDAYFASPWLSMTVYASLGLALAPAYYFFFRLTPVNRQGGWYGVAIAVGYLTWVLFSQEGAAPNSAHAREANLDTLRTLFNLQTAIIIALAAVMLKLFHAVETGKVNLSAYPAPAVGPEPECKSNIAKLLAAVCVFFILNTFLGAKLFPILGQCSGSVYILFIVAAPILGALLDIGRGRMFSRIATGCGLVFMFSPSLAVLDNSPFIYAVIHYATTVCHLVVMMSINIAVSAMAKNNRWATLLYTSVHMLKFSSLGAIYAARNILLPAKGEIVAISTFLAVLFFALVLPVNLTELDGIEPEKKNPEKDPDVPPAAGISRENNAAATDTIAIQVSEQTVFPAASEVLDAAEKADDEESTRIKVKHEESTVLYPSPTPSSAYAGAPQNEVFLAHNLSPRECEVAAMMLRGESFRQIAGELLISEHTVKTHSRNILGKFNVSSRKDLLELFSE